MNNSKETIYAIYEQPELNIAARMYNNLPDYAVVCKNKNKK